MKDLKLITIDDIKLTIQKDEFKKIKNNWYYEDLSQEKIKAYALYTETKQQIQNVFFDFDSMITAILMYYQVAETPKKYFKD